MFRVLLSVTAALSSAELVAQRMPFRAGPSLAGDAVVDPDGAEFHFARLIYSDRGGRGGGFGRGSWTTDMPEAEHFFMEGLTRLTLVDGTPVSVYNGAGGERVDLLDGSVYEYPFLYGVEVGRWTMSAGEIAMLRDYLLRGGFLMVDDFHGSEQWAGFVSVMQRVFPDRAIVDIDSDNEVFHVLYDLDERIQVPGLAALYNGTTYEGDGVEPTWRGIYDDDGRLIVAINHNMDLGDAWEHADTPEYPEPMTALAYRFAVNYVIYAMTH
ncbi:MAG: hypothetical protein RLZZ227_2713 [Pseudomonadota bacterium]|jgi:hypothetical protein